MITHCETLPLYPGSPTEWTGLYTALKLVQGINVSVSRDRKTIVSLDLQLYAKCMELRSKEEVKDHFISRLGELHVVFAFLKVLGKYIFGSGLDQSFLEADIYGPTTLGQILDGKHMKRGMKAHTMLYLSLTRCYYDYLSNRHNWIDSHLTNLHDHFSKDFLEDGETMEIKERFVECLLKIDKTGIFECIESEDNLFKHQARYLRNYMRMFETLLLFQRASKEENWQLHLASLHAMVTYF